MEIIARVLAEALSEARVERNAARAEARDCERRIKLLDRELEIARAGDGEEAGRPRRERDELQGQLEAGRPRRERDELQGRLEACRQRAEAAEGERDMYKRQVLEVDARVRDLGCEIAKAVGCGPGEDWRPVVEALRKRAGEGQDGTKRRPAPPEPVPEDIPDYAWAKADKQGFPGEWHAPEDKRGFHGEWHPEEALAWCEAAALSHAPAYVAAVPDGRGRCFRLVDKDWSSRWHRTTDGCCAEWLVRKGQAGGKDAALAPAESVETGEAA